MNVFVLFSIINGAFDPALVGVFRHKESAQAAKKKLTNKQTVAFILELPLCYTTEDYMKHFTTIVSNKVIDRIKEKRK